MAEIYRTVAFLPLARDARAATLRAMRCEVLLYDGFDELDALAPWEVLSSFADVRDDLDAALVTLDGSATCARRTARVVTPHRALSDDLDVLVVPGGGWNDRSERGRVGAGPARRAAARHPRAPRARRGGGLRVHRGDDPGGRGPRRRPPRDHPPPGDLRPRGGRRARRPGARGRRRRLVTAGGVTSGLDLALHLAERCFGADAALAAERELEYERRGTVWRANSRLSPA